MQVAFANYDRKQVQSPDTFYHYHSYTLTYAIDIPQLTVVSPSVPQATKFFEKIVMMVEVEAANILVDRRSSRIPSLRSQYSPPPSHPCAHILDIFST
ncbi:hypothetical protein SeLEV6574_g08631 [Synchytrium endobioticum]|uniref:Uncharacterized protein n=1 Tax=Synchytrium endobioticum TaxID=286115 RepID=A0A507BSN1_9FUNG|nr:hypothetical protein SeLEV6574_g08631 [Synchytrium endobioticum]